MMNIRPSSSRRGFTLIELAIVLAIAGVLFVGLWRLLAGGNQQIKDTTAATQQEQLIAAVKAFLATPEGQLYMTYDAGGGQRASNAQFNLPLPGLANAAGTANCKADPALVAAMGAYVAVTNEKTEKWCNSLPPGFYDKSLNAYTQTYAIGIRRDGTAAGEKPHTYSFMIVTVGGDTIPDSSGGRISAQIGADGGFIYSAAVCTASADINTACGAFGAWKAALDDYSLKNKTTGGHIASRTFSSPEDNSAMPWLARPWLPGDATHYFNTMTTDLYMGKAGTSGTSIPTNINMAPYQATTGGGNINMQGGQIDLQPGTGRFDASLLATVQPSSGTQNIKLNEALVLLGVANPQSNNTGNILEKASAPLMLLRGGCTTSAAINNPNIPKPANVHYDANCGTTMQVDGDVSVIKINTYDAYGYTFFYSSDRRLKSDIKPITDALQSIMKIEPVSFTFNNAKRKTMGVIAQDIEKIYPDIVSINSKDGMKAVAYHELISPMIEAIQELKRENDSMRKQLEEQEKRIKVMEKSQALEKK